MILKNKSGNISITILVIGVLVLCTLAILSFYMSSQKFSGNFLKLNLLYDTNTLLRNINFYSKIPNGNEIIENKYKETSFSYNPKEDIVPKISDRAVFNVVQGANGYTVNSKYFKKEYFGFKEKETLSIEYPLNGQ